MYDDQDLEEKEAEFIEKWQEVEQRLVANVELAGELYRRYGRRQPDSVTLPYLIRMLWRARALLAGIEDRIDPSWQAEDRPEPGPKVAAIIEGLAPDYLLEKITERFSRLVKPGDEAMCADASPRVDTGSEEDRQQLRADILGIFGEIDALRQALYPARGTTAGGLTPH